MTEVLVVSHWSSSVEQVTAVLSPEGIYDPQTPPRIVQRPSIRFGAREPRHAIMIYPSGEASELVFFVQPEPEDPQTYFWTPEWQEGEREADQDIRLGRTWRFSRVEEAIAWLRG